MFSIASAEMRWRGGRILFRRGRSSLYRCHQALDHHTVRQLRVAIPRDSGPAFSFWPSGTYGSVRGVGDTDIACANIGVTRTGLVCTIDLPGGTHRNSLKARGHPACRRSRLDRAGAA